MEIVLSIILLAILVLFLIFAIIEILFRKHCMKKYGRKYHVSIKFPWNRSYVVPHPFLSYAYKRNETIDRNQRLPYKLHDYQYWSFKEPLRLNNLGHFGKDFVTDKPVNCLRIACLGDSTTANNIADGERDYCYPDLFEENLTAFINKTTTATP